MLLECAALPGAAEHVCMSSAPELRHLAQSCRRWPGRSRHIAWILNVCVCRAACRASTLMPQTVLHADRTTVHRSCQTSRLIRQLLQSYLHSAEAWFWLHYTTVRHVGGICAQSGRFVGARQHCTSVSCPITPSHRSPISCLMSLLLRMVFFAVQTSTRQLLLVSCFSHRSPTHNGAGSRRRHRFEVHCHMRNNYLRCRGDCKFFTGIRSAHQRAGEQIAYAETR